ncbi:helix-turn-helix domain-containing protein [Xenorhabdus bovienii]|uniref:helix-turn-helix domain-containing protein n=1 Tax=Xenorhabdus bovienii TaxID=40576 RepID=UPI00237CAF36|nr:helix-turn-helix domain-containing protein [Xenorhabdus bovienii]MDE1497407.1 helix-turn-helix domain-containing protein [Xenorhabdus bovienii]MDE9472471.1 helix-turn-helix domain-containing protein [Xenorhabdus bovienii]
MNSTIPKELQKPLSAEQTAVFNRLANLSVELVAKLAEKKQLASARNMTDNELAKLFFETQLDRTSEMSPREQRKISHLNESAIKFSERLKTLGGTCRASQAAEILGVKRQTINNRLKANKLLAVKTGGEHKFPIFQFYGNRVVDGLEEVLALLEDFSSMTKTSFLTSMYFFDDEEELNVIDALKKYGTSGKHMTEIHKQAALFGYQIPR